MCLWYAGKTVSGDTGSRPSASLAETSWLATTCPPNTVPDPQTLGSRFLSLHFCHHTQPHQDFDQREPNNTAQY